MAPVTGLDRRDVERRARRDLRRQIASLEQQLAELFATSFPRAGIGYEVAAAGGPRILGVRDLERVRDRLASRLREAQEELSRRTWVEERNRETLERMIAEPERYPWVRISNEDVGERGCKHWHSRPKWGPLGMFLSWWRVKLSSGCPLAEGRGGPASRKQELMARKSRKRRRKPRPKPAAVEGAPATDPPARRQTSARRRPEPEGAPPAPWGSFPLVELAVLVGIVILVIGFLSEGSQQGILIGTGLVLCSVAGLELAIREHFAGYRSHTLVLAAVPAVATLAVLFYLAPSDLGPGVRILIGAAVFGLAAWGFTSAFRSRSGGYAFRVKAPRTPR